MRRVPQSILDTWVGGEFTGDRRPMARVTVQRLSIQRQKVDAERLWASAVFGQADIPKELPNVKSVDWDRSLGTDAATCTIVFYNTAPLPLGQTPVPSGDFDMPGYYTYNYGKTSWSNRWGTTANDWAGYLMPDRILRTYEGYGFTHGTIPEADPKLVQTGIWMIDDVEYGTDGLITVTCRDLARLLLDHLIFPPVIPLARYPMLWEPHHQIDNPDTVSITGTTFRPTFLNDSGTPWYGKNHTLFGHKPSHAFDSSNSTYWLSVGNANPNAGYAYEWIEGNCAGKTMTALQLKVRGGPYRVYFHYKVAGKWVGSKYCGYDARSPVAAPNGSNLVPYHSVATVSREGTLKFTLPGPTKVDAVRLTFTSLWNSGLGTYKYRAAVRDVLCSSQKQTVKDGGKTPKGNYKDYTEIVKYLLACGGFHWPNTTNAYFTRSDGTKATLRPLAPKGDDDFLKSGRIWGDLEMSGTTSYVDGTKNPPVVNSLDGDVWDQKSLMEGINYVRELLGFVFFVDETGGAVFRMPNIYSLGNYVGDVAVDAGYHALDSDPTVITTIDERQTVLGLRSKISSANLREYVFVANATGQYGASSAGYNPLAPEESGMWRVGGWTDQGFRDFDEAQRMADLITLAQAFTYRTNTVTIVANPALQIDDQVRIYERLTGEGYYHYIKGIRSTNDLEQGQWTYNLTTNWLGESPFDRWAFDPAKLKNVTQLFIEAMMQGRPRSLTLTAGGAMHMTGARL